MSSGSAHPFRLSRQIAHNHWHPDGVAAFQPLHGGDPSFVDLSQEHELPMLASATDSKKIIHLNRENKQEPCGVHGNISTARQVTNQANIKSIYQHRHFVLKLNVSLFLPSFAFTLISVIHLITVCFSFLFVFLTEEWECEISCSWVHHQLWLDHWIHTQLVCWHFCRDYSGSSIPTSQKYSRNERQPHISEDKDSEITLNWSLTVEMLRRKRFPC